MGENLEHIKTWNALLQGDQSALEDLYNQHYIALLNYGFKFIRDREVAKDCIFQLFLRLWDTREKLKSVANVRSYLITCMRNELLVHVKSYTKKDTDLQHFSFGMESSYEDYLIGIQQDQELQSKLKVAFGKLSDREKELLRLKFFDDQSYDEIAIACNISKRTAYNTIHSALKVLKQSLIADMKGENNTSFLLTALRTIVF